MYDLTRDLVYLGASTTLTVAAAWKLHQTGRKFLMDVFPRDREIADSVNHMLVTTFCLIMAGYLAMTVMFFKSYANLADIVPYDLAHFGGLLMFLGFTLFLHVYVLSRMRGEAKRRANHGESILA
jgi:hypothetical protein